MKTNGLLRIVVLFFFIAGFIGCNDDEPKFSSDQIQQALFDMKGTYNGTVKVSYYKGKTIADFPDEIAVSKDSLTFSLSLLPVAETIKDDNISQRLREIGEVEVKAGYEFYQMEQGSIHFVLHPKDVTVVGGHDASPSIRIVFSHNFGGDAEAYPQFMMFNISPVELWIDDKKPEEFSQLVYHFQGTYK